MPGRSNGGWRAAWKRTGPGLGPGRSFVWAEEFLGEPQDPGPGETAGPGSSEGS